jgi:hypothetical protein
MSKTPQTRLSKALRDLAPGLDKQGLNTQATRCQIAAANLDKTAASLGARGERVKQLGAYSQALEIYRQAAGQPYEA